MTESFSYQAGVFAVYIVILLIIGLAITLNNYFCFALLFLFLTFLALMLFCVKCIMHYENIAISLMCLTLIVLFVLMSFYFLYKTKELGYFMSEYSSLTMESRKGFSTKYSWDENGRNIKGVLL